MDRREFMVVIAAGMVLLNDAGAVAEAFYAYVQSPSAREIMARYGFVLPEGE